MLDQVRRPQRGQWRVAMGLFLIMAIGVRCHQANSRTAAVVADQGGQVVNASVAAAGETDPQETFARTNPLGFLQSCWDHYQREIEGYRCTFVKQERIKGRLREQQTATVRFREEPFSVDMTFVENVQDCKRALYVEGRWFDDEGNPQALAKPGGSILRALVPSIKQPVNGYFAKRASRRTIDEFGFGKTFELIMQYSREAELAGDLDLRYVGQGRVDERPTYVLERILPYAGDASAYPDARLVMHIDQEWLLPTGCFSYADPAGNELLGSYVYTDVVLNPGYTDADFDPDAIDF